MSAYNITQIEITDPTTYAEYLKGVMSIFARYDDEILVTTKQDIEIVEGNWALPNSVPVKFSTMDKARSWHADPDYQALAEHRWKSAQINLIFVEGIN